MTNEQRRELARELTSLADLAVAMTSHEPGSEKEDQLNGSTYHMYRAMAGGHYAKASKIALEVLASVGLTIGA